MESCGVLGVIVQPGITRNDRYPPPLTAYERGALVVTLTHSLGLGFRVWLPAGLTCCSLN
jgi:hypothetical protein